MVIKYFLSIVFVVIFAYLNSYSQVLGNRELITNGGFSDSLKGYTTEYEQYSKRPPFERTWLITKNPNTADSKFSTLFDHTKDSKAFMMFVNGDSSETGNKYFLSTQVHNLETKFKYRFSYWLAYNSSHASSSIRQMLNGAINGQNTVINSSTKCQWNQYNFDYYADNVSTLDIKLYDDDKAAVGNDFAIDDLSLRRICDFPPQIVEDTIKICSGESRKINVSLNVPRENLKLQWLPTVNIDFKDTLNPTFTGSNSDMYYLTVTDNYGCSLTDSIYVKVYDYPNIPSITAENDGLLCPCKPIKLSVPTGYTYKWSSGEVSNEIYGNKIGKYTVDIFNEIGCPTTLSLDVKSANTNLSINIDTIAKSIGEKFSLPISIIASDYSALKNCAINSHKVLLSYNKSILLLDSLSKYFTSSATDTETIAVEVPIYDSVSTMNLGFTATLGNSKCTDLILTSASACKDIVSILRSGYFCLNNICTEPSDRLIKLSADEMLSIPFPNPIEGEGIILFSTPEKGLCEMNLYNALGEFISKIYSAYSEPREHNVIINSQNYPSGFYIYELITPSNIIRRTMIIQ